jgi:Rrf2 family nitric oxide-sensitive transcriptional repressor
MRLTTFTDYSLRMLIHVAGSPGERSTIASVAKAFDISESHLVKVAHLLGREGFLSNTRGRGGGLSLAVPAASINVGRVVRITEGADVLAECFLPDGRCPIAGHCRLQRILAEAAKAFYEVLEGYTLADLVTNRRELGRILHWHPPPARH